MSRVNSMAVSATLHCLSGCGTLTAVLAADTLSIADELGGGPDEAHASSTT